jgi:hypothetical protein
MSLIWNQSITETAQTRNLPRDIVKYIMECGKFKNRNGIWMAQIAPNDPRYAALRTIKSTRFYIHTGTEYPVTCVGVTLNHKYLCKIIIYDFAINKIFVSYHISNL